MHAYLNSWLRLGFFCAVVLIVVGICWAWQRRLDREAIRRLSEPVPDIKRIWGCVRFGGGGTVYTPRPMTEEQAFQFCCSLGAVAYVDRNKGFIFYRPAMG